MYCYICTNTAISDRGFATRNRTDGYAKSKIQWRSRKQSAGTDPPRLQVKERFTMFGFVLKHKHMNIIDHDPNFQTQSI